MVPAEGHLVDVAFHVLFAEPMEDAKLGTFKLSIEGFGSIVVNFSSGELLLAVVDV